MTVTTSLSGTVCHP